MALTLAITGASGFLGRACVGVALARGHRVRALTRRPAEFPESVEAIALDLADPHAPLATALDGVDAVIHAAAALRGGDAAHRRDTLQATANLLAALDGAAPDARLVLVSSIAVYNATAREITEDTPLEPLPGDRDAYARAKLAQEALLAETSREAWIARPGFIYGPGHVWNAHLGLRLGPLLLRFAGKGQIPLVCLGSCADALVMAAARPVPLAGQRALNLVESDLPDARRYLRLIGPMAPRWQLPAPVWPLALSGQALGLAPPLRRRLPGLLQPRTLKARFGAKSYSNARAADDLAWVPRQPLENALHAAVEASR